MDEDFKLKYVRLAEKVKLLLITQEDYFKRKNIGALHKSKALEKEIKEMINPKPSNQAMFDWLAL